MLPGRGIHSAYHGWSNFHSTPCWGGTGKNVAFRPNLYGIQTHTHTIMAYNGMIKICRILFLVLMSPACIFNWRRPMSFPKWCQTSTTMWWILWWGLPCLMIGTLHHHSIPLRRWPRLRKPFWLPQEWTCPSQLAVSWISKMTWTMLGRLWEL